MPHHKRDWSKYNKDLVNRGSINLWIPKKALKSWKAKKLKKSGRPFFYSETLIEALLTIRYRYHLSLRETEGFFRSLLKFTKLKQIPSYTQICRRGKKLQLPENLMRKQSVTDIIMDTTGLKLYGEGEWCKKRYGGRAKWVKLHVAIDMKSGKLILAEASDEREHDTSLLKKALSKGNKKKGKVLFDGIADSKKCYESCRRRGKRLLTPPQKGAVFRKEKGYEERNETLKIIKGLGGDEMARSLWGKLSGYSARSRIEGEISRWKRLLEGGVRSRNWESVKKEVQMKAMILNKMRDEMKRV